MYGRPFAPEEDAEGDGEADELEAEAGAAPLLLRVLDEGHRDGVGVGTDSDHGRR